MTGVPVVSIGGGAWAGPAELWEGAEITGHGFDDPAKARALLSALLADFDLAREMSAQQRARAISLFDVRTSGQQWAEVLG